MDVSGFGLGSGGLWRESRPLTVGFAEQGRNRGGRGGPQRGEVVGKMCLECAWVELSWPRCATGLTSCALVRYGLSLARVWHGRVWAMLAGLQRLVPASWCWGEKMSLFHSTIVGHFDPATLFGRNRRTIRPLDVDAARVLLERFPPHVAARIAFADGYAECWWADRSLSFCEEVHEYAYLLAKDQNCIAADTPVCLITYPNEAKQMQAEAWERWREENPTQEPEPSNLPAFDPLEPGPCPYCGEPLRTSIAKQCRFCKMDWHDPANVHRRE